MHGDLHDSAGKHDQHKNSAKRSGKGYSTSIVRHSDPISGVDRGGGHPASGRTYRGTSTASNPGHGVPPHYASVGKGASGGYVSPSQGPFPLGHGPGASHSSVGPLSRSAGNVRGHAHHGEGSLHHGHHLEGGLRHSEHEGDGHHYAPHHSQHHGGMHHHEVNVHLHLGGGKGKKFRI